MNKIKLSLVAALLATTGIVSSVSANELEVSGNMAMTSTYVFRGKSQTPGIDAENSNAAIQGGFDAAYNGVYAGIWSSSFAGTNSSAEFDIYAGYAGEVDKFSYDIGALRYLYQGDGSSNLTELHLGIGYDFDILSVGATYYNGLGDATNGYEASISVPVSIVTIDAMIGNFDEYGDYYSVGLSTSYDKFDLSLAYTGFAQEDTTYEEEHVVATIGTSF